MKADDAGAFFLRKRYFLLKRLRKIFVVVFAVKIFGIIGPFHLVSWHHLIKLLQTHNRINWSHFLQVTIFVVLVGNLQILCSCMFIVWWKDFKTILWNVSYHIESPCKWNRKRKRCHCYFYYDSKTYLKPKQWVTTKNFSLMSSSLAANQKCWFSIIFDGTYALHIQAFQNVCFGIIKIACLLNMDCMQFWKSFVTKIHVACWIDSNFFRSKWMIKCLHILSLAAMALSSKSLFWQPVHSFF